VFRSIIDDREGSFAKSGERYRNTSFLDDGPSLNSRASLSALLANSDTYYRNHAQKDYLIRQIRSSLRLAREPCHRQGQIETVDKQQSRSSLVVPCVFQQVAPVCFRYSDSSARFFLLLPFVHCFPLFFHLFFSIFCTAALCSNTTITLAPRHPPHPQPQE